MERRRLISWLTAPAAAVVGLLLYGAVLGGIASPGAGESDLSREEVAAPVLRHGAAASLPPVAHRRASSNILDGGADATRDAEAAEGSDTEMAIDENAFNEGVAFRQSVLEYVTHMLPIRDGRLGGLSVPGQIDYRDPTENGIVPLVDVRGRRDASISEHFRVRDFAAKDGAQYARISEELVELMDDLTEHFGRRVHINSAYRHPGLNFSTRIDGAFESRHMAGLAADIWVEDHTAFEVAQALVNVRGCRIGLGLGAYYVHVDLRDYAASWTYPGAAMAEADFDLWMIGQCEEFVGESLRLRALQEKCAEPLTGFEAVEAFREEIAALARGHRRRSGVVLVDVKTGDGKRETGDGGLEMRDGRGEAGYGDADSIAVVQGPRVHLSYLSLDNPLVRLMGLQRLVDRAERNDNFVFVVVDRDGSHRTGIMRYDGTGWSDRDAAVADRITNGTNAPSPDAAGHDASADPSARAALRRYDDVCAGTLAIAE